MSWQELTQEEAEDYVDDEDMNEEADVDVGGMIQYLIDFSHHYQMKRSLLQYIKSILRNGFW